MEQPTEDNPPEPGCVDQGVERAAAIVKTLERVGGAAMRRTRAAAAASRRTAERASTATMRRTRAAATASRRTNKRVGAAAMRRTRAAAAASCRTAGHVGKRTHRLIARQRDRWRDHRAWRVANHEARQAGEHRRIDRVDLLPLARVSACYSACVVAATLVAAVVLWLVLEGLGIVSGYERFMRGIGFRHFRLIPLQMLLGLTLIGVALMTLMVVFTVLAGAFYNALSDRWGGVTVHTSVPVPRRTKIAAPAATWAPEPSPNGNGGVFADGGDRESWHTPVSGNGIAASNGHAGDEVDERDEADDEAPALPFEESV